MHCETGTNTYTYHFPGTHKVKHQIFIEMATTMKVINLDEIRPKQYESNIERYGEDGCIICGRPLSERDMENGKFVHMLPNGDITDSQELDGKIPENHDLGWWQVGCTCYKNFLKAAYTKPVKTWMVENGYAE